MSQLQNTEPQAVPSKPRSRLDLKIIGVIALLIVAFFIGRFARPSTHDHGASAAAAETATEQMYTCSMDPEVRQIGPGKCPICGMDLIPVPGAAHDHDEGPRTISLSPRTAAMMQVQTSPVERREVTRPVRLYGRVDFDEAELRVISARVDGRLDKLFVEYCCAEIDAGDPMVLIYSPTLISAQQELLQAHRTFSNLRPDADERLYRSAKAILDASHDKLRLFGLLDSQIDQILKSARVEDQIMIYAPIGGTILTRDIREGQYVQTGDALFRVADLSHVWVNLEAYEADLPWLREGAPVTITVAALPGQTLTGEVTFIEREMRPGMRTVRLRAELPNRDGALKPGMFARATVQAAPPDQKSPLVIPASAPLITGKRAVVYVSLPDRERPTFQGRDIVLGPRVGDHFVVESGLEPGELVVTHGNFMLDSELQLRGQISMMAPEGDAAPDHHHGQHVEVPKLDAPAPFVDQLGKLIGHNFAIVEALSQDDADAAHSAASAAHAHLAQIDDSLLDAPAQSAWRSSYQHMHKALDDMLAADDIRVRRQHFEHFSNELTTVVRVFGRESLGPVYRAVCPMVDGRRGYWLQPQPQITNPYWGQAMYRCGEIAETLVEMP